MSDSELIKSSSELAIRQEQRFEQLNLKELGLQPQDFAEVMDAHKELADISTTVVAEYGKNIANKTSTYTDELQPESNLPSVPAQYAPCLLRLLGQAVQYALDYLKGPEK